MSGRQEYPRHIFYYSRFRLNLILLLTATPFAGAVAGLFAAPTGALWVYLLCGLVLILFGYALFRLGRWRFRREPVLVIDGDGIFNRQTMRKPYPWSDVRYVSGGLQGSTGTTPREFTGRWVFIYLSDKASGALPSVRQSAPRWTPQKLWRSLNDNRIGFNLTGLDASLHEVMLAAAPADRKDIVMDPDTAAPAPSTAARIWSAVKSVLYAILMTGAFVVAGLFALGLAITDNMRADWPVVGAFGGLICLAFGLSMALVLRRAWRRARGQRD